MWRLAILLVAVGLPNPVVSRRPASFIIVRIVIPASLLLFAALGCALSSTRRWWRLYVMSAAFLCYGSIMCAAFDSNVEPILRIQSRGANSVDTGSLV
jgi:hypothetical protein